MAVDQEIASLLLIFKAGTSKWLEDIFCEKINNLMYPDGVFVGMALTPSSINLNIDSSNLSPIVLDYSHFQHEQKNELLN